MKRICIMMLIFLLCLGVITPVMAKEAAPRLVDQADLLTDAEEKTLLSKLDSISAEQDMDVVVLTVDSLNGKTAQAYSEDYYDNSGYAEDTVMLLLSMEERDWRVSGFGYGTEVFTSEYVDEFSPTFTPYLSSGDYAKAFDVYASECAAAIKEAKLMDHVLGILVCVGIGLLVAIVATSIMKGKLKTVRAQAAADNYIKKGSLNLTHKQDIFLYREVSRREKPKNDSSGGGSSSSRRSSGGGGKF